MRVNVGGRRGGESPLHLKLRIVLTRAMPAEEARLLLHRAVETGTVPPGIELRWIDWEKGTEGRVNSGVLTGHLRQALADFYGAITHARTRTRFERVDG